MDKKAERTNVLTETENKSFIHAVINAVTKGYSDNTVLEDIMDLVRRKEVSKGVITSAPDALRSYGESLMNSLKFLADQIDQLEIIDEPTVKKREPAADDINVVEQEMEKQDKGDGKSEEKKAASFDKFANLEVSEDWEKYSYNKKTNMMTGCLKFNFKQDMNSYKTGNRVVLPQNDIDNVLSKIYSYFNVEFKNLKAELSPDIFKTGIKFGSIEKGEATVDYEIKGAF